MPSGLTEAGSAAMVASLCADGAEVAAFRNELGWTPSNGTPAAWVPLTDWQPYDPDVNTGVAITEPLLEPSTCWVHVRGHGDAWRFWWPISTIVHAGDTVHPPHPREWFSGPVVGAV